MAKIKILLADNSFLIREGFRNIINENKDFRLAGETEKPEDLAEKLALLHPHVLVIDYTSRYFCMDDILVIHQQFPKVNILAITPPQSKAVISKVIENGVITHLLKDCGKDEIVEAIHHTAKGQKFFCGKVIDIILKGGQEIPEQEKRQLPARLRHSGGQEVSCEGIKLSVREIEITRLVADGLSNKKIADKLFLSIHTITTHRKNIMSKLGVNNTAGLVMYAIRENLVEPNKTLSATTN